MARFGSAPASDDIGATGGAVGNAVALATAFCFAGMTVTLRKHRGVDMVPAMCVGRLLVFLGIPLLRGLPPPAPGDLPLILGMGVVQLAVPVLLYVRAARHVPAMQMALFSLLDAPLNPFRAWLGVGEVPAGGALVGGGVIAAAVVPVVLGRRPPPSPAPPTPDQELEP